MQKKSYKILKYKEKSDKNVVIGLTLAWHHKNKFIKIHKIEKIKRYLVRQQSQIFYLKNIYIYNYM